MREVATEDPGRPALMHGERTVSYGELEARANRIARLFATLGLARGDHVACLPSNGPEIIAIIWGAYRSGLYLTPIPSSSSTPEAAYLIGNCRARVVLASAAWASLAGSVRPACPAVEHWFAVDGAIEGFPALDDALAELAATPRADETPGSLMMYTSGTTGRPKGVWRPLPPPGLQGPPPFARDLLDLFALGGADVRYLSTAPLYHAAPLRFALAVTAGGGRVVLMDHFDAAGALDLLESHAITHSQWVPAMFHRLLDLPEARRRAHRAPAHRVAYHGAAPCPPAAKRAMIDWWGPILWEYYSGSEGVGLTSIRADEWLRRPGSVGRARKGVPHIVGDDGCELAPGATGVVWFSGVAPFAYFEDPGKTASRTSPEGWQTFGDVGHLDADGYLYLTDRLDDMIISGGVNVYPQEVEAAIAEVPGVAECAVVGIRDERFGERPIAFVVPRPDADADPDALRRRIEAHNETRLGRFKRPARIRIVAELPRSPTGKLLRRLLR